MNNSNAINALVKAILYTSPKAKQYLEAIKSDPIAKKSFPNYFDQINDALKNLSPVDRAQKIHEYIDRIVHLKYEKQVPINKMRIQIVKDLLIKIWIEYVESYKKPDLEKFIDDCIKRIQKLEASFANTPPPSF